MADKETKEPKASAPAEEQTVKLSDVQKMIEAALKGYKQEEKPLSPKKVTEHVAHLWRFDGKWVVDFKDQNTDPYIKEKLHTFKKFDEQRKEFVTWIELVFQDGSTKQTPLTRYIESRVLVYCPILKRHQEDKSYSTGTVEKKKENSRGFMEGSGVTVQQEVTKYEETFELRTPEGDILLVPWYAIA